MQPNSPSILSPEHVTILQGPMAINLAISTHDLRTAVTRGFGCKVLADRSQVVVFVIPTFADQFLKALAHNKGLAAIFSHPITLESLQLKGIDAREIDVHVEDFIILESYRCQIERGLFSRGFSKLFVQNMTPNAGNDVRAIAFKPLQLFAQTPGPKAGQRISG